MTPPNRERFDRPFLHVRDLAAGNVRLLDAAPATYNVSGESLITLRHIISELASVFGREPAVRVNEQRSIDTATTYPRIDRMRALGWTPRVTLRDGLVEMVQHLAAAQGNGAPVDAARARAATPFSA